ncbi:hypothetical protein HO441_00710 [Streptococcus suis]|nr:hypothetical protein [Streptococcus suis]
MAKKGSKFTKYPPEFKLQMLTRTLSSGPGLFAQPRTYMMLNSRIHK